MITIRYPMRECKLIKPDFYKIFCTDMDGTLLDSNKDILPRTNEAIKQAQERGMLITVMTGRPLTGLTRYQELAKWDLKKGYAVCLNGSVTYRLSDHEIIASHTCSGALARKVAELAHEHGCKVHAFSRERQLVIEDRNPYTEREIVHSLSPFEYIDFAAIPDEERFYKIMIVGPKENLDLVRSIIPEDLSSALAVMRSDPNFLEFIAGPSSKGTALVELCKVLNIDIERSVAFGDAENDATMLKNAGFGVAMANSAPEALEVCDYVTLSNDEDGIAAVLEQL